LKFLISDFFITPSLRFDANMKKYKNKWSRSCFCSVILLVCPEAFME
jgi:hypothetical protein